MPLIKDRPWWRPLKKVGPVTVAYVDLSRDRTKEAWAWLDRSERARYHRYLKAHSKREFSLCRGALRAILCEQLGCPNRELHFETNEHGKPFALLKKAQAPIDFNVSHSGSHGLIAWSSRGRVGVDVEERDAHRNLDGGLQTVFAPREQAELARAQGEHKRRLFFDLWAMKEALVKALGVGLAQDISQFELPKSIVRGDLVTDVFRFPRQKIQWRLQKLGNARYAAALAFDENQ
ncbi:MAG: 4'-phosphopantetheinyl transferase superfamily protein [Bacteriovoracales bacterium]|nr:4'-phosphopantetheinyl transferase superfamily protein [Bacteriovoracales bacterium]